MSLTRLFGRLDDPSPLLKQTPTTLLFLVALLITLFRPDDFVRQLPAVVVSVVLVVFATILALVLTPLRSLRHLALLVPAIDFFAIGLLRFGTGVTDSAFAAIIILPMVWVASEMGRRYIGYAALGTAIAMLLPLVLDSSLLSQSDLLVRAAVSTLVFAVAGSVVNELARHSRLRLRSALDDAQRRKRMLEDA
ncbi:MAG: regulator, partial [Terrimesophilobacter sp.]